MHFKGKTALEHVIERRAKGVLATAESHGTEMPGHISAGADAAKETAVALLFIWLLWPSWIMALFALAWTIWRTGRSGWLAYSRLERLHRVIEEERWEIEHHRPQEREELAELYQAKGFEGQLLEEVLDVLMADQDRLLRVMLEEELGLSLEVYEHPLKQAFGALLGCLVAVGLCFAGFFLFPLAGLPIASFIMVAGAGATAAIYEGNKLIPAIVWNLAIAFLAASAAFFLGQLW